MYSPLYAVHFLKVAYVEQEGSEVNDLLQIGPAEVKYPASVGSLRQAKQIGAA
jgi:hypothetical protein